MAPLLVAMCERIANRKIPDDTVPKFMDGLLDIARDGVDRAVGVVQTSADGIAGSAEAELGQLGSEIRGVVKAANPRPPRSIIEHMFDKVSYRIEGDGPVTAVLTYQNREYRHTSRTMWLGLGDGMPQGSIQLDEHVWARLQRINGTIEATITDSGTGESYTLTPE